MESENRLFYIDKLRLVLTTLAIAYQVGRHRDRREAIGASAGSGPDRPPGSLFHREQVLFHEPVSYVFLDI
jgi:hypothetical protein